MKYTKCITPNVFPSHQPLSMFVSFFHNLFKLFTNPFPDVIFRGTKRPSILESWLLKRFSIFLGSQTQRLGHIFGQTRSKKLPGLRPGRALEGAIWRQQNDPRVHVHPSGIILAGFWNDLDSFMVAVWCYFLEFRRRYNIKQNQETRPQTEQHTPKNVFPRFVGSDIQGVLVRPCALTKN